MPIVAPGRLLIQLDAASQEVGGGSAFRALMGNADRNFKTLWEELWGAGAVTRGLAINTVPGLRLSAQAGVAIPSADRATAINIYGVPCGHNVVPLYDTTSGTWLPRTFTSDLVLQLSATQHAANREYSVFVYWDAALGVLRIGSAIWPGRELLTSGTVQYGPQGPVGAGTAETEAFQGRLVNKYVLTVVNGDIATANIPVHEALLIGGFATTPFAGTTEDSAAKRLISNVYNVAPRTLRRIDPIDSWAGDASDAWRYAAGNTRNQIEFFSVTGDYPVTADVHAMASGNGTVAVNVSVAIGWDNLIPIVNSSRCRVRTAATFDNWPVTAHCNEYFGQGRHALRWLEKTGAAGAALWAGDAGDNTNFQSGMFGMVYN